MVNILYELILDEIWITIKCVSIEVVIVSFITQHGKHLDKITNLEF